MSYSILEPENNDQKNVSDTVLSTIATKIATIVNISIVEWQPTSSTTKSPNSATLPAINPQQEQPSTSHILAYVLVPLGSLILIAVLSFLVVFILKKSKLDKLRHHLMPLYNFDPAEEEGDWESELLEEDKEQHVALHIGVGITTPSPTDGPKLKFQDHMDT